MKDLPDTDDYSIRFRDGQTIAKPPGTLNGRPFVLEELTDCEVSLFDYTEQLTITGCKNTTIRCGPCSGICTISQCSSCMIAVAAYACIVTASSDVIVFLYSSSEPEVQDCSKISFAPYNLAYPRLREQFQLSNLELRKNLWSRVKCDDRDGYGSCWILLQTSEFFVDTQEVPAFGAPEDVVPRPESYGGTLREEIVIGSMQPINRGFSASPLQGGEEDEEPVIIYEQKSSFPRRFSPAAEILEISKPQSSEPAASNPSLPMGSGKPGESPTAVFIASDGEDGFLHAAQHPAVSMVASSLADLTALAVPHYRSTATLQLTGYLLGVGALLLYLFLVLLDEFVSLHPAALALLLFLLTVGLIALTVFVVLRWRAIVRACNSDLATYTTAHQGEYSALKLEVLATMAQVTVRTQTTEAVSHDLTNS